MNTVDLSTKYLGFNLKNPLVVASCGLTRTAFGVEKCANAGAGAVVMKSVFEEQINMETEKALQQSEDSLWHPEAYDYMKQYSDSDAVSDYLKQIEEAKKLVAIPVIGSIHCVTAQGWADYARKIEAAGADAIELNMFVLPSDPRRTGQEFEQVYFDAINELKSKVNIPIALKIGYFFSGLASMIEKLSLSGIDALVLFNRFVQLDFDLEKMTTTGGQKYSSPSELNIPLRWVSIMSDRVKCDLSASTGIHDGTAIIKQLLAGASTTQVCSALYKNGVEHIETMLKDVEKWIAGKGFNSVEEIRGKLAQSNLENPAALERVQFMKIAQKG